MKKIMTILLTIHCSLFTVHFAWAQIINVPADYPTIQAAINAANPGDTVIAAEGTYYEQVNFIGKKPLLVASRFLLDGDTNHINSTILDGSLLPDIDNASVVLFTSGEDTTSILCGFTVRGGRGTWDPDQNYRCGGGIFIHKCGAKIIHNKIIHNMVNDTESRNGQGVFGGGIGTSVDDADYWIVVEENQIYYNSTVSKFTNSFGGGICDFYNARISGNVISENSTTASANDSYSVGGGFAHPELVDNLPANYLVIQNNKFQHNTAKTLNGINGLAEEGAVHIWNAHITFTGNEIINNICIKTAANPGWGGIAGVGIIDPAEGCVISGNVFQGNNGIKEWVTGCALHLENFTLNPCPDPNLVVIADNYFVNNQGAFPALNNFGIPVLLLNNVFSGNQSYDNFSGGAISLYPIGPPNVHHLATIINCSFYNNKSVLYGGAIYSLSTMPLIRNSVFWSNTAKYGNDIYLPNSDSLEISYSDFNPAGVHAIHILSMENLDEDPLFILSGNDSLALSPASPCIDAGTPDTTGLFLLPWDILGNHRIWDGNGDYIVRIDMGAYEYGSTPNGLKEPDIFGPGLLLRCYPNPTTGPITIETPGNSAKSQLTILNLSGQEIMEKTITEPTTQLDISYLPAGIYLYRISNIDKRQSTIGKIVKY